MKALSRFEQDLFAAYRVAFASRRPPRACFTPPILQNSHKTIRFLSVPQANYFKTKNEPADHGTEQKIAIFAFLLLPMLTTFLSRVVTQVRSDLG